MALVRGDLPEHAALSQCSHCRNVNNENKAKRGEKRERERGRELTCWESSGIRCARCPLGGYFHLLTPAVPRLRANFSPVEGTRGEKRVRPEKVKSPPHYQKRKKCERDPITNHFLFINVSNRGADQLFTPARCRNVRS